MIFNTKSQMEFFSEMSERQLTAREFFGGVLLDSLKRNFQLGSSLIMFFDPAGRFLSWTGPDASLTDSSTHPYRKLRSRDVIGDRIYLAGTRLPLMQSSSGKISVPATVSLWPSASMRI